MEGLLGRDEVPYPIEYPPLTMLLAFSFSIHFVVGILFRFVRLLVSFISMLLCHFFVSGTVTLLSFCFCVLPFVLRLIPMAPESDIESIPSILLLH